MLQILKKDKTPKKLVNETQISNLSEKEFKVTHKDAN